MVSFIVKKKVGQSLTVSFRSWAYHPIHVLNYVVFVLLSRVHNYLLFDYQFFSNFNAICAFIIIAIVVIR